MFNKIRDYSPDTAIVERLRSLERDMREFKQGVQYPSIGVTEPSSVYFTLYDSAISAGGDFPTMNLKGTLTGPTGKRIMAIPEFSLFWGAYAVGNEDAGLNRLSGDDRKFPEGNRFANFAALPGWYQALVSPSSEPAGYGRDMIDVNWWFDWLYSFAGDGEEVAAFRIRLDAALQNQQFPGSQLVPDWTGNGFTFMQWWRYLNPGAYTE